MDDLVVIDEFHLTLLVPRSLGDREAGRIRRILRRATFVVRLADAVREVCRRRRPLDRVEIRVSR